jgi:hypothetical protein
MTDAPSNVVMRMDNSQYALVSAEVLETDIVFDEFEKTLYNIVSKSDVVIRRHNIRRNGKVIGGWNAVDFIRAVTNFGVRAAQKHWNGCNQHKIESLKAEMTEGTWGMDGRKLH